MSDPGAFDVERAIGNSNRCPPMDEDDLDAGRFWHEQPAGVVKRLLSEVPDDHFLVPNSVKNLTILDGAREYVGYVDLGSGDLVWFTDDTEGEADGD